MRDMEHSAFDGGDESRLAVAIAPSGPISVVISHRLATLEVPFEPGRRAELVSHVILAAAAAAATGTAIHRPDRWAKTVLSNALVDPPKAEVQSARWARRAMAVADLVGERTACLVAGLVATPKGDLQPVPAWLASPELQVTARILLAHDPGDCGIRDCDACSAELGGAWTAVPLTAARGDPGRTLLISAAMFDLHRAAAAAGLASTVHPARWAYVKPAGASGAKGADEYF
jgi:hypothetical protein